MFDFVKVRPKLESYVRGPHLGGPKQRDITRCGNHPDATTRARGLTGEVAELEGDPAREVDQRVPVVPQLELRAERAGVHLAPRAYTGPLFSSTHALFVGYVGWFH